MIYIISCIDQWFRIRAIYHLYRFAVTLIFVVTTILLLLTLSVCRTEILYSLPQRLLWLGVLQSILLLLFSFAPGRCHFMCVPPVNNVPVVYLLCYSNCCSVEKIINEIQRTKILLYILLSYQCSVWTQMILVLWIECVCNKKNSNDRKHASAKNIG